MTTAYEIFERQYIERTKRSKETYEKARRVLPGGVAANAGFRSPHPIYMKKASGAYIIDVDDNQYLDIHLSGGPHVLGHSPPAVMDAVRQQLDHGTATAATNEKVIELAGKICEHLPGMEMVRFVNTGSEAVSMSLRAARAYTGRDKIGKFEGHFHGQSDSALIAGSQIEGPEDSPEAVAQGAGIPKSQLQDTVVLPFNDAEAAVTLIKQNAREMAAVILEPIGGVWLGGVEAEPSFLEAIRRVTEEEGILLIFDEVVTGYRLGLSGAVSLSGVMPDLRAMGKVIGGGFPTGAFGGRTDIMEEVVTPASEPHERQKMYQSGTFSGNPISATAGLAMIRELEEPGFFERIDGYGDRIRKGLREMAADLDMEIQAVGRGSIFGVFFGSHPIRNIRDVQRCDAEKGRAFFMGLVANGIFVTPFHLGFTNGAQTDEDIDRVLEVSKYVLTEMKRSG